MKALLKALREAERKSNELDALWEMDPDNEILEAQWDIAYKEECKAYEATANELVRITSGMLNLKTAMSMLKIKRDEVEKLFV